MRKVSSQESVLTDLSADLEAMSLHSNTSTSSTGGTLAVVLTPPDRSPLQNSPILTNSVQSLSDPSPTDQSPNLSSHSREKPKKRRTRSFLRRIESLRRKDKEKPDSAKAKEEEGMKSKSSKDSGDPVRGEEAPPKPDISSSFHSNLLSTGYRTNRVPVSAGNHLQPESKRGVYLEDYETALEKGTNRPMRHLGYRDPFQGDYLVHIPGDHKPGTFPKSLSIESLCPLSSGCLADWKAGSRALGLSAGIGVGFKHSNGVDKSSPWAFEYQHWPPSGCPMGSRASLYDNVPEFGSSSSNPFDLDGEVIYENLDDVLQHVWGLQQTVELWSKTVNLDMESEGVGEEEETDSGGEPTFTSNLNFEERSMSDIGTSASDFDSMGNSLNEAEDIEMRERRDSGVGASLTRPCR